MMLTKCKLGELVDVTRGMSLSGQYYSEEGELIRLTLGNFNMNGGGFKKNTSKSDLYFTGPVREEFILKKGDIITPLTEQSLGLLGTTARIPESGKYIQSQDVALVRCKPGKIDPNFCYYLVSSHSVKQQLSAAAQQTKIRHTSPEKIMNCTVWVPEMQEQERIGALLTAIDSKIELNCSINRNLEALAKQLYDYWFVQFDFPNEYGRPYKSSGGKMVWNEVLKREVPEGWEEKRIGEVLGRVKSTPRLVTDEYLNEGKYPIIDQTRTVYYAGFTNREDAVLNQFPAVVFGDHSCAVKYVNFPFARGADGTQILIPNNERVTSEYLYFVVQNVKLKEGYARHFSLLKDSAFVLPSIAISKMYAEKVVPFFEQIKHNRQEIIELTHQRDELLPLLMNGQVEIMQLNSDL